jgi:protein-S-isoprenylcysteine O-methyltransferase Ste14
MLIGSVILFVVFRALPNGDWSTFNVQAHWVHLVGLLFLVGSTVFTLWSRVALGNMWSAAPAVKEDHVLRTGGPYAVTRHPIYTGILGMLLGTTMLVGVGRWVLLVPVGLVLYEMKIGMEERLMLEQFPDEYASYRARVPQLIPGLYMLSRRF